jgi:hypothetical protein
MRVGSCSVCVRTVYLAPGDAAVCPVCSTPLTGVRPEPGAEITPDANLPPTARYLQSHSVLSSEYFHG